MGEQPEYSYTYDIDSRSYHVMTSYRNIREHHTVAGDQFTPDVAIALAERLKDFVDQFNTEESS